MRKQIFKNDDFIISKKKEVCEAIDAQQADTDTHTYLRTAAVGKVIFIKDYAFYIFNNTVTKLKPPY